MADLTIWDQAKQDRTLLSLTLELTARCNNNCVHCYINVPAGGPPKASREELSLGQIKNIIDEAVSLGALWVLLSGGEPLLRPDFSEIYLYIKRKGLLVSVFTNGSLITEKHVELFKQYPPRDIEITVYGVSEKVHKKVTRKNTFSATSNGIDLLINNGIPVTLKSTLMKSNVEEIDAITEYCQEKSDLTFRFDPALHLRLDRDLEKNKVIISERLTPEEIVRIEKNNPVRVEALHKRCNDANTLRPPENNPHKMFRCRAGINSCCIDATGVVKLCTSLCNEHCIYDLTKGSLAQAWNDFIPQVLQMESNSSSFTETCGKCNMHDICSWCPAHADLESGILDSQVDYFCNIAHTKNNAFRKVK